MGFQWGKSLACFLVFVQIVFSFTTAFAEPAVVISSGEYAPWCGAKLHENGFDLDLISRAFAREGYDVEYQFSPWARAYEMAVLGDVDATASWYEDKSRKSDCLYSDPIRREVTVLFYRGEHPAPDWQSLEDLAGLKIGAVIGFTYTSEFWKLAESEVLDVHLTSSDETNFKMLAKGRLDVVISSLVRGKRIISDNFASEFASTISNGSKPITTENVHLLFSKKFIRADRLQKAFNKGLRHMKESGEYDQLYDALLKGAYSKSKANRQVQVSRLRSW